MQNKRITDVNLIYTTSKLIRLFKKNPFLINPDSDEINEYQQLKDNILLNNDSGADIKKIRNMLRVNPDIYDEIKNQKNEFVLFVSESIFLMSFFKSFKKYAIDESLLDEKALFIYDIIKKFYKYFLVLFGIDSMAFNISINPYDKGIPKEFVFESFDDILRQYMKRGAMDKLCNLFSYLPMTFTLSRDKNPLEFWNSVYIPYFKEFYEMFLESFIFLCLDK